MRRRRLNPARMRKYATGHGIHARSPRRLYPVQHLNVGVMVAQQLRATWAAWWSDGVRPPEGTTLRWSDGWLTRDLPEAVTVTMETEDWPRA